MEAIFVWADATFFFVLCLSATSVYFIICLFLAIFKAEYSLKKRGSFLFVLSAFCALLNARAVLCAESDLSCILLAAGLVFFVPLLSVRVKPRRERTSDDASRRLIRFIDDNLKRAAIPQEVKPENRDAKREFSPETDVITASPPLRRTGDIDFSHVKNVLSRMETVALSAADRRQMHELEYLLFRLEKGDGSDDVKQRLNEGLGNLLKIMAKHGV